MKMFLKGVPGGCSGWDKQGQDRQSPALLGCTACGSGRGLKTSGQSAGLGESSCCAVPGPGCAIPRGSTAGGGPCGFIPASSGGSGPHGRRRSAAGAAKALGASVSPGGAVEAGEGTRARPVGLEARSREGALQGRALQTGCFC